MYPSNGATWQQTRAAPNRLASNNVTALARDVTGRIWMGTGDAGVSVVALPGSNWATFDASNVLPSDAVADLAVDGAGDVWVATANGLGRYDRARRGPPSPPPTVFRLIL